MQQSNPQSVVPAARQYGTSGRPVKVLANTFSITTLPTQTIYHYDGKCFPHSSSVRTFSERTCSSRLSGCVATSNPIFLCAAH
ncbi:hypothetical protein BC827DRAFT_1171798 [Russula dissimulans]|nr:hypothetical protein BC827DRAFT_1171798 [Russula dissimulans]